MLEEIVRNHLKHQNELLLEKGQLPTREKLREYALSKNSGVPRSTILYPTLAANAVEQVVLLKDPIFGHKRAEVILRPVNLLEMEGLIRPRQGAVVARKRQEFAHRLAFGNNPVAQFRTLSSLAR